MDEATHPSRRIRVASALAVAFALSACGDSPTNPAPIGNTPPTIQSLTASSARVEADAAVTLTAVVQDAETPLDRLTYQWSAAPAPGVFTGNGRSVIWTAPHHQATPAAYTLTLTVIEHYTWARQPRQNIVSSSVQIHYNDSAAELTNLGTDFLINKFGNYDVSPQACVSNFSDSCRGKADELSDIIANRQYFHILSATFSVSSTTFNSDRTFATVVGPCVFMDIIKSSGVQERVPGICTLTGVYGNYRWLLCDSHDAAPGPSTVPLDLRRYRGPG